MQRAGRVDDRRSCLACCPLLRPVHSLTRFVLQYIIVRQLPVSGAIASTCFSYFRLPLLLARRPTAPHLVQNEILANFLLLSPFFLFLPFNKTHLTFHTNTRDETLLLYFLRYHDYRPIAQFARIGILFKLKIVNYVTKRIKEKRKERKTAFTI